MIFITLRDKTEESLATSETCRDVVWNKLEVFAQRVPSFVGKIAQGRVRC